MIHGSWLKGAWPGPGAAVPRHPPPPHPSPAAPMRHEPLTIHNRLIHEIFDYLSSELGIRHDHETCFCLLSRHALLCVCDMLGVGCFRGIPDTI